MHFDMLRVVDVFFDEDGIVAEGIACFAARFSEGFFQFLLLPDDPHSASAAAGTGLEDDRIADAPRLFQRHRNIFQSFLVVFDDRYSTGTCHFFRADFVAQLFHDFRIGADENDAFFPATTRELDVLREKTIAGMDRLYLVQLRDTQDLFDIEVRLQRIAVLSI